MVIVMALSMAGLPKLLSMLDPEIAAEVNKNQADMHAKLAVRFLWSHFTCCEENVRLIRFLFARRVSAATLRLPSPSSSPRVTRRYQLK